MVVAAGSAASAQARIPSSAPARSSSRRWARSRSWQQQATPAFGAGLRGVEETVAGKYLDPTQQAPFQALSTARQNIAQQMFEDAQGNDRIQRYR